jgi:hypothetical protein
VTGETAFPLAAPAKSAAARRPAGETPVRAGPVPAAASANNCHRMASGPGPACGSGGCGDKVQVRHWQLMATSCLLDHLAMLGLPEYVCARLATEVNPISVDMTSPGYALIVARSPAAHRFPAVLAG